MRVTSVTAMEILDSRGYPTLEVTLHLGTIVTRASVPSGKSTGRFEALERRDGDAARHGGRGVLGAVEAVNTTIAAALVGHELVGQERLDRMLCELDGTPNKSRLGANAIVGVSMAAARARAVAENRPLHESLGGAETTVLPVPCFNVLNGGAHAPNKLDFQEFMLVPAGRPTYADALRVGAETYHALGKVLDSEAFSTAVGDEGGFEDGLAEDDREGWRYLTRELGGRVQLVGDDIFVSDAVRVRQGIESGIANAVLLKPNQVGTITEIGDTARVARGGGYRLMMSHRSGETDDAFVADLAVALNTGQIKAGAPARGERVAKYNQLARIELELGTRARYAGLVAFSGGG